MTDLLTLIASKLVDEPDKIEVTETEDGNTVTLTLKVAPDDMGKIIGRNGRNARSIRTLMKAAATQRNKRVIVDIIQ